MQEAGRGETSATLCYISGQQPADANSNGRNPVTVSATGLGQNYSSAGLRVGRLWTRDGAPMKTCLIAAGQWNALRKLLAVTVLLVAGLLAVPAATAVELNPEHPENYVVKRGDTLWDISAMFLRDPWFWPEIWYVNPQISNPHLIYPGDILTLVYVDGKPQLQLQRGPAGVTASGGAERLSPGIRTEDLDAAIKAIPYALIEPFLTGGMIMDKAEADALPYVVALRDHLIAGAGHEVYVRNVDNATPLGTQYSVLRLSNELRDPDNGARLGYEVMFIGTAELRATGDPDTFFLTNTNREVMRGDRLRTADLTLPMNFYPQTPSQQVNGTIISVLDGVSRIGQYQMVIINKGLDDGLDAGSVLAVWQRGEAVRDAFASGLTRRKVQLPDNLAGNVMVVKAYENVSYALVMEAVSEMRVGDRAINP